MGHRSLLQVGIGLGALLTVSVLGYACSSSSDTGNTGGGGTSSTGTGGAGTGMGGTGTGTGGTGTGTGGTGTGTGGSGTTPTDGGGDKPPVDPCTLGEAKGMACSATVGEGKSCYNTCGPDSIGYKLETCTAGVYVEGMCAYLQSKDYSCYKIPASPPACPMDAMGRTASQLCPAGMTDTCKPCGPNYGDSSGAAKIGYCVCNSAGKWTCGSTSSNSWPCSAPGGANTNPGCQ